MIQGTIELKFGVIWITMLTLKIGNSCKMRVMSCVCGGLHSPSALVVTILIFFLYYTSSISAHKYRLYSI